MYVPPEVMEMCIRVYCTICLLDDESGLLEREVLSKDRKRYEETQNLDLVSRALKRGINGWNVGNKLQQRPGYRNAYWAIRWCGRGRKEARLRLVRGYFTHREVIEKIPSGREANVSANSH